MTKNGITPQAVALGQGTAALVREPHVLVVGDEQDAARRLAREFKDAGFQARAVFDDREAMAASDSEECDLIVLDARLLGLDGLQCLRQLHARHGAATPPVLLLTGEADPKVDAATLVYHLLAVA
jgi:DNA-binding response OmpR family regulator